MPKCQSVVIDGHAGQVAVYSRGEYTGDGVGGYCWFDPASGRWAIEVLDCPGTTVEDTAAHEGGHLLDCLYGPSSNGHTSWEQREAFATAIAWLRRHNGEGHRLHLEVSVLSYVRQCAQHMGGSGKLDRELQERILRTIDEAEALFESHRFVVEAVVIEALQLAGLRK